MNSHRKCFLFFLFIGFNTMALNTFSQQLITGVLIDSLSGQAIAGVAIFEANTSNGTITNEDGEFQITVNKTPATINFSHISYKKKQKLISNLEFQKIYLSIAVIQLPEVKTGNLAIPLLNAVIRKAITDTSSRHYYKAFYQKISTFKGKYTKIHEMFLNVSWGQQGADKWEPTNVRYAQMEDQKYNIGNMSFLSFLHSATIQRFSNFPINTVNISENYDFKLKHYINAGTDEEIAVIECYPNIKADRKTVFEGQIFVKTRKDNILRIVGDYIHPKTEKGSRVISVDVNFVEDSKGFSRFDNLFLAENIGKKAAAKQNTERVWLLFYEEISEFGKGKIYPAFIKDDLKVMEESPYNSSFWEKNIPLKHTKLEEEVIQYFEKKKQFKSNF